MGGYDKANPWVKEFRSRSLQLEDKLKALFLGNSAVGANYRYPPVTHHLRLIIVPSIQPGTALIGIINLLMTLESHGIVTKKL